MQTIARRSLIAVRKFAGAAFDLVLPGVCLGCGQAPALHKGLCQACNERLLAVVALPYCPRCGATVGPGLPVTFDGCRACPAVLPRFSSVVRLGPYAPPLRSLVRLAKYHRLPGMRGRLADMLAVAAIVRLSGRVPDVVMPVPMHWRRRMWKGYDHARLLAAALAGKLRAPLGNELLRVRNTPPQVHLPRSRRIENVRNAFAVRNSACLREALVLLVDDVTTTGATACEAARTLLDAGAAQVVLAVVAKSEPPAAYADRQASTT
jgi:ComF family protein